MSRRGIAFVRVVLLLAFALFWEAAARLGAVDASFFPPPSKVLNVLGQLLGDRSFRADVWTTTLECIVASAIVVPLGLGVGFAVGESPQLNRMLSQPLQLLMTIPKSIFLPVFILMFGIGFGQKVIFAIVLAFFIVVPTGVSAAQSVPQGLVTAARAFGASRRQVYLRVYLPAMAPVVIGGVRLGVIFAIHGVILAEMYASSAGLGRSILDWGESSQMDYLFAAVLLVVGFTVALNETLQTLERASQRRFSGVE